MRAAYPRAVEARTDTREASHRRSQSSPVASPASEATSEVTASSAVIAASLVANPPRRTRRRSPDAGRKSALTYQLPRPGDRSSGQRAPSSFPVDSSRHPHRRYTEP